MEWEGKILHRSGEALLLEKAIDRFTLALHTMDSLDSLAQLREKLEAERLCLLSTLALVEFRVSPDRLDQAMQQARECSEVRFASHVYAMDCSPNTPIYLTNQITVQFAETTDVEVMRTIAHSSGLQVAKLVPGVPKAFVFAVTQRATANPIKLSSRLLRYPQVLMAEPNVAVPIQHDSAESSGDPPEVSLSLAHQEDIAAAWALTKGDRSVVLALAESEINWQDPRFQGMGKLVAPVEISPPTPNFGGDGDQSPPALEDLGSEDKIQNPIEVAPGCALMPIGMGNWLDDQLIEQICQWAIEQGAAILACGWRADAAYFPLSLRQRVALFRAATQGRQGKGCVVVFGARTIDRPAVGIAKQDDENDENVQRTKWLNGFALHPDVIAVAAGMSHAIDRNEGADLAVCAEDKTASAIVAGAAALMLSVNPDLTARAVKQILQDTQANVFKAVQVACQRIKPVEIPDRWLERHNLNQLDIPDGDLRGGCSAIDIADAGLVKAIEISLEVAHSFMGDLEIVLISPGGKAILLQNRTLARITTLHKTYSFETTPALKSLLNQPVAGQWQLKLVDHVVFNTGQLKQWQLRIGVKQEG